MTQSQIMTKFQKKSERIGKVSIEKNGNRVRLRFSCNSERFTIPIGEYSKEVWEIAKAKASQINSDILYERLDVTLESYGYKPKVLPFKGLESDHPNEVTIKDCWLKYKELKNDITAHTTKYKVWRVIDNWIESLNPNFLALRNLEYQVKEFKDSFKNSRRARLFTTFNASLNLAVKLGVIPSNPYNALASEFKNTVPSYRTCKAFTHEDVKAILEAFKTDSCMTNYKKGFKHSYYYQFVAFLFLTGCRPQDAIALQWSDIIDDNLIFRKAYTHKALVDTKTKTIRVFPINNESSKGLVQCWYGLKNRIPNVSYQS